MQILNIDPEVPLEILAGQPAANRPPAPINQNQPVTTVKPERQRPILIVDDDPGMRTMLQTVLEDEGYNVEMARNGREALDRISKFKPSLILLDIMMPVMDGWQFLEEIQKDTVQQKLPIVVLSASRELARVGKFLGVKGCLPKPFDLEKLLEFVRQYRHTLLI